MVIMVDKEFFEEKINHKQQQKDANLQLMNQSLIQIKRIKQENEILDMEMELLSKALKKLIEEEMVEKSVGDP